MEMNPFQYSELNVPQLIDQIRFTPHTDSEKVTIDYLPSPFRLIGTGTDAIVVQHIHEPAYVYKVFSESSRSKLDLEYQIYQILSSSPYFCTCYSKGSKFLKLSYEEGVTLYQCLQQGIPIPEQVILDVNDAIRYAKKLGLNPRDIHLKNIILQNGRGKLIDVSEYLNPGNDERWEYIREGYYTIYPYIKGKKIPAFFLNKIKNMYFENQNPSFIFKYLQQWLSQRMPPR